MVVRDDSDHKMTIGSAALQCAVKNAKLAPFSDCSSIDTTMDAIKAIDGIKDETFWFGVFAPGEISKREGKRNFLEEGEDYLINS